jgi:Putative amidase domain
MQSTACAFFKPCGLRKIQPDNFIYMAFLLSIFTFLTACNKSTNHPAIHDKIVLNDKTKTEVFNFIQGDLSDEYKLLTVHNTSEETALIERMKKGFLDKGIADRNITLVTRRRNSLKIDDLIFSNSSVIVEPSRSTISMKDDVVIVKVAAMYELPTNSTDTETGKPITTKGIDFYDFEIVKSEGTYFINEKSKVADFPSSNLISEEGTAPFQDSIDYNVDTRGILGTYSPAQAISFAAQYVNKPPTAGYYNYETVGGDCTNFASHCLKAGGWIPVNTWHWNSNGTSCESNMTSCARSPSWAGAPELYKYLTNSGASRVTVIFKDIEVYYWYSLPGTRTTFREKTIIANKGDIIQLSNSTVKTTVHHTMIVTLKDATAKKIFVTYRNGVSAPVAQDKFIGDISGGQLLQGFAVKSNF